MNERIRELAIEARQEFLKLPTGYTPEQVGMYPQLMEKFAELIVQRTLAIVEAHTEIFQSDQARAMVEHIKHSVKTDFGVE